MSGDFDQRGPRIGMGNSSAHSGAATPGKSTLVAAALPRTTHDLAPVQLAASADKAHLDSGAVQQAAATGVAGAGGSLPHRPTIQQLFGRHDIRGINAHVGGAAATASHAIGAEAYATGNNVAFAGAPSLHTAAHEAAHVVQQRGGVQLKGGVGESGDAHEQHANAVADAVVQGKSAEGLLDRYAGGTGEGGAAVQREESPAAAAPVVAAAATAPAGQQGATPAGDAAAPGPATQLTPDDIAAEIIRHPEFREGFLEYAGRVNGAAFRDAILVALAKRGETAPTPAAPTAATATGTASTAAPTAALPAAASTTAPPPSTTAAPANAPAAATTHSPARAADRGQAPHGATNASPNTVVHTDAAQAPSTTPAAGANYLANYTSLGGTNLAQLNTTQHEADILNAIRHSDSRFDPVWLAKAQAQLQVVATGSFNTETLRALLHQHPRLDAAAILANRDGVLTPLATGAPFIETPDGFGAEPREATGATKADRAAHRLGYTDYAALHATLLPATLLGVALNKGQGSGLVHPHLLERLRVAETFLRQRHPSKSDKEVIQAIGWNKLGNAAYQDDVKFGKSHFHTMGLAIDIDVAHNPYIFTGRSAIGRNDSDAVKKEKAAKNWWMDLFEKHLDYAAKIFGGEKISAATLNSWAASVTTDELYARVAEISQSFAKYLAIANEPDDKLLLRFTSAGISADVARADLSDVHQVPHYFQMKSGNDAATLTNHSQELLVALRDVAGLAWGGAEMSSNENGDFMHFDCRQDNLGRVLQNFNFP